MREHTCLFLPPVAFWSPACFKQGVSSIVHSGHVPAGGYNSNRGMLFRLVVCNVVYFASSLATPGTDRSLRNKNISQYCTTTSSTAFSLLLCFFFSPYFLFFFLLFVYHLLSVSSLSLFFLSPGCGFLRLFLMSLSLSLLRRKSSWLLYVRGT